MIFVLLIPLFHFSLFNSYHSHTPNLFVSLPSHPFFLLSLRLSISSLLSFPKINQENKSHIIQYILFRSTSFWKLIEASLLSLILFSLPNFLLSTRFSFLSNSIFVSLFILFSSPFFLHCVLYCLMNPNQGTEFLTRHQHYQE